MLVARIDGLVCVCVCVCVCVSQDTLLVCTLLAEGMAELREAACLQHDLHDTLTGICVTRHFGL